MREHMLDGAAHFRLLRIGEARALRHRSALGFVAMNARDEPAPQKHLFVFRRAIGRICKDFARRVGSIEHFLQPRAVMRGRVRRRPIADQPMSPVDRDVIFVAKSRNSQIDARRLVLARAGLGVFNRPAGVAILLGELGRLLIPILWNTLFLDRLFLSARVALLGRGDNRGRR